VSAQASSADPSGEPEPTNTALRRLLQRRAQPLSGRTQLMLTIGLCIALVIATIWAWRTAHLSLSMINWVAIALAFFVAAPATLVLKMFEYDAAARLIGTRAGIRRAFEVAVLSSAANLLPIPGSLLVTTRSLSEQGATYGTAAVASAIPGLAWLGLSGIIGGAGIAIAGNAIIGIAIGVGGIAVLVAAGAMFRRRAPTEGRVALALRIVVIETTWIVLGGARFWLVLRAIGVQGTPAQVLALAVAGAMSTAIGFFPAGLGVREALIAALSPVIHLSVSEGVLLGVVDRVVWISFLALASIFVALTRKPEAGDIDVLQVQDV